VDRDKRAACVKCGHRRLQLLVAQVHVVVVSVQRDAVGMEPVERVLDLAQRQVDVREWQRCEQSEPAWELGDRCGAVLVDTSRQVGPVLRRLEEPDAGRRDRQHSGADTDVVHHRDGVGDVPLR